MRKGRKFLTALILITFYSACSSGPSRSVASACLKTIESTGPDSWSKEHKNSSLCPTY